MNGRADGRSPMKSVEPNTAEDDGRLPRLDYAGSLIIVEGVDGSGKSTQLAMLRKLLEDNGADVLFTEWNSSSLTQKAVRRGKRRLWLGHLSFVLLHAA